MEFQVDAFNVFDTGWALLTAGKRANFNTMTISWGGLGTIWGKPVATVYVKPIRYTHQFLDQNDCFTVSFYPAEYMNTLTMLGSRSGRLGDKISASGLTPMFHDKFITFEEASATLLCQKIYRQDLDKRFMMADVVNSFYAGDEPHTMYIGEVVDILRK